MSDQVYPVPDDFAKAAWCDNDKYLEMYQRSVEDPEEFWAVQGARIDWIKPYSKVKDVSFVAPDVHIKWFEDGTLNASANCLDRHLETRGDQVAFLWEGDDPGESKSLTYRQLYEQVCKFANVLKSLGIKKGDRVSHLPADDSRSCRWRCWRAPASAPSIRWSSAASRPIRWRGRIQDCDSNLIITADEGVARQQARSR